jgi:hypothetical protein
LNQKEIKMFKNRFLIVLGVLSLLLVAMAISFPLSNSPTSAERARAADMARWTAMGEYYAKLEASQLQRSRAADTARWEAMGEYYLNQSRRERSQAADAARWTAMVERYQSVEEAQNLQRGRAAEAARWTAMADYHLQVFGK